MERLYAKAYIVGIVLAAAICFSPGLVRAQGAITGTVTAADGTAPDSGCLLFFGYIDNSDKEIRIQGSDGTDYDNGNWYDDFQNYLSEAPGQPYSYQFCDTSRDEGYILTGLISYQSYQENDVTLAPVAWPERPTYLTGRQVDTGHIEIRWLYVPGLTYHIYRRELPSQGAFFRIDDTTGSLDNPGIDNGVYIDTDVDSGVVYDYILISEDGGGRLGMYSDIFTIEAGAGTFLRGDANGDGAIDIGDIVFLVNFIFKHGPAPDPMESGETNCDDYLDIGDVVNIIYYVYQTWPPFACP
jgi:hypothetical protein